MSWASAARFYHQLGMVHHVGISLAQAVEMSGGATFGRHRELAPIWSRGCAAGGQLADQLEASGEPALAVALMRAGEHSGRVTEGARMLAEHFDHLIALRGMIIARSIYPLLVINLGLMVPAIPGAFLGTTPAWKILLGPAILWAVIGAAAVSTRLAGASGLLARIALLPGGRFLAMPMLVSNVCRVLRAALSAGMLVPQALDLAAGGSGNRDMAERLRAAASDVRSGRVPDLTAALNACGFPRDAVNMIENGERSGKLEDVLTHVAVVYDESFRSRTMWTAKVITGVVYGLAMLLTAAVVLSMYGGVLNQASAQMESE